MRERASARQQVRAGPTGATLNLPMNQPSAVQESKMSEPTPPPGYYLNPDGRNGYAYWDGQQWHLKMHQSSASFDRSAAAARRRRVRNQPVFDYAPHLRHE
jgi:hypothetical protein